MVKGNSLDRMQRSIWPSQLVRWPLALLLLALSSTFLFSHERGQFYRDGHHNNLSTHHLAIAVNLSPAHDFLLFERHWPVSEHQYLYVPYNSRPPGGHILIKLATLPFDGLAAQIYAARVLMLVFSAAAALLAFDAVRRLTANPWIALAATLFAFASPYWLYYNDMVATETLAVFGVALAFHGMTIFVLEGRFRQLVAKTFAAVLLGWYVFALLLPFIVLGLLRETWLRKAIGGWPAWQGLARSHYLRFGVISLLFGLGMVVFCLVNEYRAYPWDSSLSSLRTSESFVVRFGLSEDFNAEWEDVLGLPAAMGRSLCRIGLMAVPYALPGYTQNLGDFPPDFGVESPAAQVLGFVVIAGAFVGLLFARHRVLLATAALCGLVWGIGLRHMSAFHDFESRLFVGLCVLFYALALVWVRRVAGNRVLPAVALFAVACFVQSSWSMGRIGADEATSERGRRLQADFELIRKVVRGAAVSVDKALALAPYDRSLAYYLHGSQVILKPEERHDLADFTVMGIDMPGTLTPGNAVAFLYDTGQLTAFVQGLVDGGRRVVAHADFDVYFHEGERALVYVAGDAAPIEEMRVLLHISPTAAGSLPAERRGAGFDWLNFTFRGIIHLEGPRRAQVFFLPDYPIREIATGRMEPGDKADLWRQSFGLESSA